MCEAYPGLTRRKIGDMTFDDVWLLVTDRKHLANSGQKVTGTLDELRAMGIEPVDVDESLTFFDMLYPKAPKSSKAARRERARKAVEAARREGM